MAAIATIGVYGFDRETFLATLRRGRHRPGTRRAPAPGRARQRVRLGQCPPPAGRAADAGIDYSHLKELAPTTELRQAQYRADARLGEGKRSRTVLSPEYAGGYTEEILDRVDLAPIVKWIGGSKAALLCVERDPEACHRSLIAARLQQNWGFSVEDLRPPAAAT